MQINNDYMGNIFEHNLKYLFKLTRQKNNKKIIDFCKETGIGQSTITRWKNKYIIPTRTNLKVIADYFNQNLVLNITIEDLTKNNIEIAALVVKESKSDYLTEDEKQIIEKYRQLEMHKKDTIKKLLNDFE